MEDQRRRSHRVGRVHDSGDGDRRDRCRHADGRWICERHRGARSQDPRVEGLVHASRASSSPPLRSSSRRAAEDIVAVTTKDARLLLLDAASLGGAESCDTALRVGVVDGRTRDVLVAGPGDVAGASARSAWTRRRPAVDGTRWLLIPVNGPFVAAPGVTTNGPVSTGAILAVKVTSQNGAPALQPGWVSENIAAPITPIVVNGVVFAASGPANAPARLHALNGTNGKTMWQSGAPSARPSRPGASGRVRVTCSSERATARCTRSGSTWSAVRQPSVPVVDVRPNIQCALVFSILICSAGSGFSMASARRSRPSSGSRLMPRVPSRAPAKPKQPRRLLVVNLQMRNGAPSTGAFVRCARRPELRPGTDGKADRCVMKSSSATTLKCSVPARSSSSTPSASAIRSACCSTIPS